MLYVQRSSFLLVALPFHHRSFFICGRQGPRLDPGVAHHDEDPENENLNGGTDNRDRVKVRL